MCSIITWLGFSFRHFRRKNALRSFFAISPAPCPRFQVQVLSAFFLAKCARQSLESVKRQIRQRKENDIHSVVDGMASRTICSTFFHHSPSQMCFFILMWVSLCCQLQGKQRSKVRPREAQPVRVNAWASRLPNAPSAAAKAKGLGLSRSKWQIGVVFAQRRS